MVNFQPLSTPETLNNQNWPEEQIALVYVQVLTYNHVHYIRDCIEGILMQKTTFPVKIIVFDDCSNDGTTEIIRAYSERHPGLFKLFIQPVNTYQKEIRKKAVQEWYEYASTGKYIAKCEGDDYWTDPLKLQKQVDFMEDNLDYQMTFSNCVDNATKKRIESIVESREYSDIEILTNWIVPTASVLYRSNFDENDYRILRNTKVLFGDIILFMVNANKGKIFGMKDIMTFYRHNENSVTQSSKSIKYYERLFNHLKYLGEIYEGKYFKYVKKHIKSQSYKNFRYYVKKINPNAIPYLLQYLKL